MSEPEHISKPIERVMEKLFKNVVVTDRPKRPMRLTFESVAQAGDGYFMLTKEDGEFVLWSEHDKYVEALENEILALRAITKH
jgi:hypothetical protein